MSKEVDASSSGPGPTQVRAMRGFVMSLTGVGALCKYTNGDQCVLVGCLVRDTELLALACPSRSICDLGWLLSCSGTLHWTLLLATEVCPC